MIKTKCFKNALQDMRQRDVDTLESGVQDRIAAGATNLSTIRQAEISAARDLLAEIEQERADVLRLANEQHPELNRTGVKGIETLAPESAEATTKARAQQSKPTKKEQAALDKALAKQKARDEASFDFEADEDISGYGEKPDRLFAPPRLDITGDGEVSYTPKYTKDAEGNRIANTPRTATQIAVPARLTSAANATEDMIKQQLRRNGVTSWNESHPLHGATYAEAAALGAKNARSPLRKALFRALEKAFEKANGRIAVGEGHNAFYSHYGYIYLNDKGTHTDLDTLLHELVHAATHKGLSTNTALDSAVSSIRAAAQAWFNTPRGRDFARRSFGLVIKDRDGVRRIYGLKNNDEFLAEAFSNKKFQDFLQEIPSQIPKKSLFTRFVEAVSKLFGATTPSELNLLHDAIAVGEQVMNFTAEQQGQDGGFDVGEGVLFAPKRTPTNPALGEAAETFIGGRNKDKIAEIREHATGLSIRTRFVDNYAALKEALKRGDAMPAIQVTYDLMNYAQRNHFVQQAVTVGAPTRSWWAKEGGKDVYKTEAQEGASMKRVSDLLNKVEGFGDAQATSDAFTMYALAKRAADTEYGWARVFADTPTPHNATAEQAAKIATTNAKKAKARAEADKLVADENSPFKAAYKEYQDWNKGMLQFAMQAGVVSQDEFRRLSSKQNYTPLFRSDKHGNLVLEIDRGRDITVGRLADEPHLQKLLGGDGQVMDFFTASVRNASVLIDASLHNIASREAYFALQAMGAAHPVAESEKGENVIEFRKDGVLQRVAVDTTGTKAADIPTDLLIKGFAGVPASLPGFVRMMGVPAQVLRKAVTRNPLYMARQLIRDPLSAWLTTGAKFNPITDTLKEMSKSMTGTADTTLDRRGITGGALFSDDAADFDRIRDEAQSEGQSWSIGYYMAKLDHAAHAADAITRRNVYNGAIKEGASEIQATLAAYESMPFSKRGTSPSMRYLNHMVPFLSAAIQGWDVLYRSVKGDMPLNELVDLRTKLLSRGAMIAGMSMMYAMAMADDDQYQQANTSERLNNWFVRVPGLDAPLKVPVPFELGIIFKMIPEALVRIMHSDKDAGSEIRDVGGALAAMAPNIAIPQALIPLVEATLNKSFFTGNAIEGRALEGMDIGARSDANTSELSKALGFNVDVLGKQVGLSPKMFEYVMSQYTAGLYPALAALVDTMLPAPTPSKPDRKLAEMPLFRSALLQEDAGGEINRLYDKIDKFTKASTTLKHLQETNPEKAVAYFEENKDEVVKGKVASKMKAAIDKISNAENKVRASNLSPEQKREALDNFKRVKSNLATQFSAQL